MKVLVDLPDELYDALRNKTLNLTSDARSNGKHLVYELIGCVLNGVVIKDIRIGDNVFRADDLTIVAGKSIGDYPIPEREIWNYDNETCKYCSTNPNNGGSGVCHCTLAVHKIT